MYSKIYVNIKIQYNKIQQNYEKIKIKSITITKSTNRLQLHCLL